MKNPCSLNSGTLFVVATPIGNLEDASERMKKTLSHVTLIMAEDTRRTKQLIQLFGFSNRVLSYHKFNEVKQSIEIIEKLLSGENVALVSDAGTPNISDPGSHLVSAAHRHHIPVRVIPGPCAVSSALSVSGFEASNFIFHGFLPSKSSQRLKLFEKNKLQTVSQVFYESPNRVLATIKDMISIFGQTRQCCFCRELTKLYETVLVLSLAELYEMVENDDNQQRGEIVLVLAPFEKDITDENSSSFSEINNNLNIEKLIDVLVDNKLSAKSILAIALQVYPSVKKNQIYPLIIEKLNQ